MPAFSDSEIREILYATQSHGDVFKLCTLVIYTGARPTYFKGLKYSDFRQVGNTEYSFAKVPFRERHYIIIIPNKVLTLCKKMSIDNSDQIVRYDHTSSFPRLYRTLLTYVLNKAGVDFNQRNGYRAMREYFLNCLSNAPIDTFKKLWLAGKVALPEPILSDKELTSIAEGLAEAYDKTSIAKLWVF